VEKIMNDHIYELNRWRHAVLLAELQAARQLKGTTAAEPAPAPAHQLEPQKVSLGDKQSLARNADQILWGGAQAEFAALMQQLNQPQAQTALASVNQILCAAKADHPDPDFICPLEVYQQTLSECQECIKKVGEV
jgi:hypothetical protein